MSTVEAAPHLDASREGHDSLPAFGKKLRRSPNAAADRRPPEKLTTEPVVSAKWDATLEAV